MVLFCLRPKRPLKSETTAGPVWSGRVALLSRESGGCSHSVDPPYASTESKLRTSAKKTSPLRLLLIAVREAAPARVRRGYGAVGINPSEMLRVMTPAAPLGELLILRSVSARGRMCGV